MDKLNNKLGMGPNKERVLIIALLFITQLVWLFILLNDVLNHAQWLQGLLTGLAIIMVLHLLSKNESPAYRMGWIILITAFPIFGGLTFLLFGNQRATRGIRNRLKVSEKKYAQEFNRVEDAGPALLAQTPRLHSLSEYIRRTTGYRVSSGNQVAYYPTGEACIQDILQDLARAQHSIYIEFFIVEPGHMFQEIFDILVQKAQEGLDVRFIYDDFGCITRLPGDFDEVLEDRGIQTLKFNPLRPIVSAVYNARDHRKYIIIDNEVGYSGGMNLADEYINVKERFGHWKDTMVRVQGPGVWNYTVSFLNFWNAFKATDPSYRELQPLSLLEAGGQDPTGGLGFVQVFDDSPLDNEPVGETVYREILNTAEDYVYVYTPYLIISYELQTAMTIAAKRGVDVRLVTPGIPDKKLVYRMTRSYYPALLKAGVRIYEYSPGFLHAKTFVSDDRVATVGSINLDYRSLYLHFETNTVLYHHPVIQDIRDDFNQTFQVSKEISLSDTHTSLLGRFWDAGLRLIAPLV